MQAHYGAYTYIPSGDAALFTAAVLPKKTGRFPVVVMRSPYVEAFVGKTEEESLAACLRDFALWLERGYAVVFQHCRGRGKSTGDCIPYINEREDGLCLLAWIRKQPFYNGELYLYGKSYRSSVHYATAPFGEDIRGAVFGVQDCERYNICYRNGFFKRALHGEWAITMYRLGGRKKWNFTPKTFDMLPLKDFTRTVLDENIPDLDGILAAPDPADPFWQTRLGGCDARDAVKSIRFPALFTTSFNDIYTGGIFDMWNGMDPESRERSALVVSPYDHGDNPSPNGITFPDGRREEAFGTGYEVDWFDYIRGKAAAPFATGKVTYYRLFANTWQTDTFAPGEKTVRIRLGEEEKSYVYNPYDPPEFKGGLSRAFGGAVFQDPPDSRHDIISVYTAPFEEDTFVKGKMSAKLRVASDREDTCFYIRVSIAKAEGDFGLRDDITSLSRALGAYTPGTEVTLDFEFDEHAFLICRGEKLRIDIASADNAHYVRHTNQKGLYSTQTTAKIARNTVYLQDSVLCLPTESKAGVKQRLAP